MKDIEDRLKEEYDKVEVPDYMFDTSRVFKRVEKENNDSKKKVVTIAASIVAILILTITLLFTVPKILKENEANIEEIAINNTIKGQLTINNKIAKFKDDIVNEVAVIKVKRIIAYEIIERIPYTIVKAQVLNNYYGDLSGEIEIYVPGGIFTIKDIKDNIEYNQIDDISQYDDEDQVKLNYFNEIFIPIAEEGCTYLTSLNINERGYFVAYNKAYGFKEYDPETNIVKDDMGDEQLDIDRYLESINI